MVEVSALLSIMRAWRLGRDVWSASCLRMRPLFLVFFATSAVVLALVCAFLCAHDARSSSLALSSGSQVGSQVRPVLGFAPCHLIKNCCFPRLTRSANIHSASQYVGLALVGSASLELTYLCRLLGVFRVESRLRFVGAITRVDRTG